MSDENEGDAAVGVTAAGVADPIMFEIKEYSQGSESATSDDEHPSATGPPQSTSAHSRSVSEAQNGGALSTTAEDKSSRSNQTPGAKRGGRRVSGNRAMLSWSRLTGTRNRLEIGDLVEAEWKGSGSWYVGYVEGKASVGGTSRRSKGVYHVVFADGDEVDVHGRDLKQLGASGHAKGSAGTLPRHVPVADLGSGRLHQKPKKASTASPEGKAEANPGKGRGKSARGKQNKTASQQGGSDSAEESETTVDHGDWREQPSTKGEGREVPPPLRRGSAGNVYGRRDQAEQAVWGGRRVPPKNIVGGGAPDGGGGDWWETGTRYAFQPRLVADKPTVRSVVGHGGGAASHRVGNGGGGRNGESGLTRHRGSGQNDEGDSPLRRVIQPAEGNSARGQRVFFLA